MLSIYVEALYTLRPSAPYGMGDHMVDVNNQLQSLRQTNADVAHILDVYDEIDRVYSAALTAMGVTATKTDLVTNSADVTISTQPIESVRSFTIR